jgi:peptidoglycan-associated lipoprotein
MNTLQKLLGSLGLVALLAGCASGVKLDESSKNDVPVETRTPIAAGSGGAAGSGTGSGAGSSQSQVATVNLDQRDAMAASRLPRVVYFDFDSFLVKDEFSPVLDTHAKRLVTDRKLRMAIEGHTDERGGREYNLALGQKRAEAVAKSLTLLGAGENQLEAVSFGKERPAVSGSDEAAWAQNRRAELRDR